MLGRHPAVCLAQLRLSLVCLFVIRKFIDVHDMRTQRDHCSISILCFAMLAMPRSKKLWEIFVLSFFLFSFCLFVILLLGLVRSMCSNPRDPLRYVHQCALPFCDPLVSLSAGFCQRRPSRSSKVQLMLVFAFIYDVFLGTLHVSHAGLIFNFTVRDHSAHRSSASQELRTALGRASYYGKIKSYNPLRGFGFISSEAFPDQDVFVLWSELPGGFGPAGSPCQFSVSMDEKGPAAKRVVLLGAGRQIQQMKWMMGYGCYSGFNEGTTCWDFQMRGTCARAAEGKCRWDSDGNLARRGFE